MFTSFPPLTPKKLIFLVLSFLSGINAIAQSDFKPGLIITTTNDTIRGFVDHKKNSLNAKECVFKKSADSESHVYKPGEINGYRIDHDKFYVAKKINGEKLFLEFLVDGIVNLYYYDQNGNDRFFLERDTALVALTNDKTTFYTSTPQGFGEVKVEKMSNKYKGVLNYEFRDDTKMVPKIRTATFDEKSLIKLVKQYHADVCTDQSCIVYTKSTHSDISIGPSISWITASMQMDGSNDHVRDTQLSYGVEIQYRPPFLFYRWSLLTGVAFSKNSFTGAFTGRYYDYTYDLTYNVKLSYDVIRIPIVFQYTFPSKKIQPFIHAGVNNVLILNPVYDITYRVFNPSSKTYSTGNSESTMENYQIGVLGGIGARKNIGSKWSLSVKADYEYRFPAQNFRQILDNQKIKSIIVSASLIRKLP